MNVQAKLCIFFLLRAAKDLIDIYLIDGNLIRKKRKKCK